MSYLIHLCGEKTYLSNHAIIHHRYYISIPDGTESVGDYQNCATFNNSIQRFLYNPL